jgi:hypothetical protein
MGLMEYGIEMVSPGITCIQSYIKTDAGVRVILVFSIRNFKGCNVGISIEKNLLIMLLR